MSPRWRWSGTTIRLSGLKWYWPGKPTASTSRPALRTTVTPKRLSSKRISVGSPKTPSRSISDEAPRHVLEPGEIVVALEDQIIGLARARSTVLGPLSNWPMRLRATSVRLRVSRA